jgi:hypothetical protein
MGFQHVDSFIVYRVSYIDLSMNDKRRTINDQDLSTKWTQQKCRACKGLFMN